MYTCSKHNGTTEKINIFTLVLWWHLPSNRGATLQNEWYTVMHKNRQNFSLSFTLSLLTHKMMTGKRAQEHRKKNGEMTL